MTNCPEAARRPDEQRLVDVASILGAGILRLRERQSLPISASEANSGEKSGEKYMHIIFQYYFSPGGLIQFGLEIVHFDNHWSACWINAEERIDVPEVKSENDVLHLRIKHYDSEIEIRPGVDVENLTGRWRKRRGKDEWVEMELPDAFAQTKIADSSQLQELTFPDLAGLPRRLNDPMFAGEARIIYVFGAGAQIAMTPLSISSNWIVDTESADFRFLVLHLN